MMQDRWCEGDATVISSPQDISHRIFAVNRTLAAFQRAIAVTMLATGKDRV